MSAMVISTAGRGLETKDACLRERLVLRVGLARLDEQRTGLFNEIDTQLAILSGAAAPAARQAPRASERAISPACPIPAIRVGRKPDALAARAPRRISRLRLAAIASAIFALCGLGWIAAASFDAWLNGPLSGHAAVDAVVARIIAANRTTRPAPKTSVQARPDPRSFSTRLGSR